ncbi:ParB/RepB/Spo0J family partition protein [Ottowia massiliensis]|uniref:ParB/RepB/Spo0J family partition protein n=1 Tax=Ottowia massiliensis TaxID=2045302 RepID=UPI000C85CB64|nr:ParB/RepB/Spo0J family partition protein [Ottowia massiliensis]
MATKKTKGLGRGLDALLIPEPAAADPAGVPMLLPLEEISPGQYQPRTRMDEGALYELAESIRAQGIMQPILVRQLAQPRAVMLPAADGASEETATAHYEIIAGERRYRAARLAGLTQVPVLVREVADEAAAAMALIENIQRENLNPLEEAQGIKRLVDEFGLTHEQAAQAVGKSRSAASNLLRLLNLAEPVQTMLMAGDIDMGHARALLALSGAAQITAANQVVARKMNVREAERLVRQLSQPQPASAAQEAAQAAPEKSGDVRRVEEELSDLLLAQVQVRVKKTRRQGAPISGELAVQFASLDELNGLIERLRQSA